MKRFEILRQKVHEKCKLLFILNEPFFGDNLLLVLKGSAADPGGGENDKVGFFCWLGEVEGEGDYDL